MFFKQVSLIFGIVFLTNLKSNTHVVDSASCSIILKGIVYSKNIQGDVLFLHRFQESLVIDRGIEIKIEGLNKTNETQKESLLEKYLDSAVLKERSRRSMTLKNNSASKDYSNWVEANKYVVEQIKEKKRPDLKALEKLASFFNDGDVYRGSFNSYNGGINELKYFDPEAVGFSLKDLFTRITYMEKKGVHPVIISALSHQYFVSIHPFVDGNGRVARLFVDWLLLSSDFYFPVFSKVGSHVASVFPSSPQYSMPVEKVIENLVNAIIVSENLE